MNLATDPWIPVVLKTGGSQSVSLSGVFQNGDQYAELAVRPHQRIALMRLLICLAQAALDGPRDVDEWDEVPGRLPSSALEYLEKWRGRFDLFHDVHPFLQIRTLKQVGDAPPVTKLEFSLATGNASTLFDHGASQPNFRSFSHADLALMLLTYLNFSPGGLISQVEWNGKGTSKDKSSGDAPCISQSMYHTLVRRGSLLASLHVNLLTKTTVWDFYGDKSWGRPVWEQMPTSMADTNAATNATRTYLGRLVPLPRLILLDGDAKTMCLGNGFKYAAYPSGPREPSATEVLFKEKRRLLGAGNRELWRELPSLISERHGDGTGGALPLRNVRPEADEDIYVAALLHNQANIVDVVESVFHLPAGMRTDASMATYRKDVLHAERIAGRLYAAVSTYYRNLGDDWNERIRREGARTALRAQLVSRATQQYWTGVEKLRPLLIAHVEALGTERFEQTGEVFLREVHRAARDSYGLACGQDNGRRIRAFALGWSRLVAPVREDAGNVAADIDMAEPQ